MKSPFSPNIDMVSDAPPPCSDTLKDDSSWNLESVTRYNLEMPQKRFIRRLPIPTGNTRTIYLKVEKIEWIKAESQYIRIHSKGKSFLVRMASMTLKNLSLNLDPRYFLMVHRSYLVNLDHVVSLSNHGKEKWNAELICGQQIPVSNRHLENLRRALIGKELPW